MTNTSIVEALTNALGSPQVTTDPAILDGRRHDYWMISHLRDRGDGRAPRPACVVRPRSVADVQQTLKLANAMGAPVIPFGLGSGVVGGVIARPDAVLLDMSAMSRVRFIDKLNLLASFDAGKNGAEAEAAVAAQGLTIGHWPQSVAVSSVGGWVATRASGQFSSAYGNIEDIIHSIEAVLPNGDLVTLGKGPRASAGPDLRHLMMGSEGTLGVITGITFSLRRAAEARALSAFEVADMRTGFSLQREIVQRGWRPPVMRQYDERESRRLDGRLSKCAILMVHEGPRELVEAETLAIARLAEHAHAESAPADVVAHWLEHRNNVPPWDATLDRNMVADTVEVSAAWDKIGDVYDDAVASVKAMPGCLAASAHSSHVYRSGLNLYFLFAVLPPDPADMESAYFEAWSRIMTATAKHGGSLSHHHGIGRVRRERMGEELGDGGLAMLRAVKAALDPKGIMNPGVLIPDG